MVQKGHLKIQEENIEMNWFADSIAILRDSEEQFTIESIYHIKINKRESLMVLVSSHGT